MSAPWLDSEAARTVGPVQRIHVSTVRPEALPDWNGLTGALLMVLLLALLSAALPAGFPGRGCCCGLVLGLLGGGVRSVLSPVPGQLRARLLLGARGLALWTEGYSRVVLWDELGTVWRLAIPRTPGRDPLVLHRDDGTGLEIAPTFEGFADITARVLAECAHRAGATTPWAERPPGPTPDAGITPAERDITEPDGGP